MKVYQVNGEGMETFYTSRRMADRMRRDMEGSPVIVHPDVIAVLNRQAATITELEHALSRACRLMAELFQTDDQGRMIVKFLEEQEALAFMQEYCPDEITMRGITE